MLDVDANPPIDPDAHLHAIGAACFGEIASSRGKGNDAVLGVAGLDFVEERGHHERDG